MCINYDGMLDEDVDPRVQKEAIKDAHIKEALERFNGYWANDYQACEDVAKKHGYNPQEFQNEVYKKEKF